MTSNTVTVRKCSNAYLHPYGTGKTEIVIARAIYVYMGIYDITLCRTLRCTKGDVAVQETGRKNTPGDGCIRRIT